MAARIQPETRVRDLFHHIDMGLLNKRLSLTALGDLGRHLFAERKAPGSGHLVELQNDHLLVTMLLDMCDAVGAVSLHEALALARPKQLFRSTVRLAPCPDVYSADRVEHDVLLDVDFGKPVTVAYHTLHIVSDTGRMILAEGAEEGYLQSIVGLLHDKDDHFKIEPIVMGAPWYDHPRNGEDRVSLMWLGRDLGEILPEDIEEFSRMSEVEVENADEWLSVMREIPEERVKSAFADLLNEPTKKDWGGETNDHFSGNVTVGGARRTAAFLLKGPSDFREMTLEMCGKRADQIFRLAGSHADISVVQNANLIGEVVRETLRRMVVIPGSSHRKFCVIDGQATYRILKAYSYI